MKNYLNNYSGEVAEDYELFILASTGDGWNTIWSTIPMSIPAEILQIELGEEYLTAGSVQIAFRFSGDTDKINNWNIDDVWIVEEVRSYAVTFSVNEIGGETPIANATINVVGFDAVQTNDLGIAAFAGITDGTYSYTVNAQGYNEVSNEFTVNGEDLAVNVEMEIDGIDEDLAAKVDIYPNPANNSVWITNLEKANINVFNLTGQFGY